MKHWKGIFIRSDYSGLCNRLRGLNALRVVASFRGIPIAMKWTPSWACPGAFEELFDFPGDLQDIACGRNDWFTIDGKGKACGIKSGASPEVIFRNFCVDMPENQFWDEYRKRVRSLSLQAGLRFQIDEFRLQEQLSTMIGVHVRRTDLVRTSSGKRLSHNDLPVFQLMRSYLSHGLTRRFFLATDNAATERLYRNEFGDAVLVCRKDYVAQQSGPYRLQVRMTSVQDAVRDLYGLSACRRLIGSGWSSFSEYAAVLGGIPKELPMKP